MTARFTIPGEPVAKGSRTAGVRKDGSRFSRESSRRVAPWMTMAKNALLAQAAGQPDVGAGPYRVTVTFYCRRPVKPTHPYPSRSDVDKQARAALDALTAAGVISDDRHVIDLNASKRFTTGEPHCEIWVDQTTADTPFDLTLAAA